MRNPFRHKKKTYFTYQFLCKTCDIFFYGNNIDKAYCPCCGSKGEVYEVYKKEENDGK